MATPEAPASPPPALARRRVVIAGAGPVGRGVAGLLSQWDVSVLDSAQCDLSSVPDTEVALAGAEVAVFVARAARPWGRLVQAAPADLDLLLADTVAQAAPMTSVKRLVFYACGEGDPREPVLRASGLPLAVLRGAEAGAAARPADELAALVEAAGAEARTCGPPPPRDTPLEARPGPGSQVCSVQRLALPRGWTARDVASAHFEWLARSRVVTVEERGGVFHLSLAGARLVSLRHAPGRSRPQSAVFELVGGALAHPRGRLEFRALSADQGALVALLGYQPALPWALYRFTQALVHASAMSRFGQWLATQPPKS